MQQEDELDLVTRSRLAMRPTCEVIGNAWLLYAWLRPTKLSTSDKMLLLQLCFCTTWWKCFFVVLLRKEAYWGQSRSWSTQLIHPRNTFVNLAFRVWIIILRRNDIIYTCHIFQTASTSQTLTRLFNSITKIRQLFWNFARRNHQPANVFMLYICVKQATGKMGFDDTNIYRCTAYNSCDVCVCCVCVCVCVLCVCACCVCVCVCVCVWSSGVFHSLDILYKLPLIQDWDRILVFGRCLCRSTPWMKWSGLLLLQSTYTLTVPMWCTLR